MRFLTAVLAIAITAFAAPAFAETLSLSGSGWHLSVTLPRGQGPFPAVILMPGCSGNTPASVQAGLRSHSERLVRNGIGAAVIDVLGRRDICADLAALTAEEATAARKAIAAARELADDPRIEGSRIGFLGQSFGGSVALRLASQSGDAGRRDFAAVAAYYPWCNDGYGGRGRSDFAVPVLILSGAADEWTPVTRCQALRPAPGTKRATVAVFPGAFHSFDLPGLEKQKIPGVGGSFIVAGDAAAAASSAGRYLDFFTDNLPKK